MRARAHCWTRLSGPPAPTARRSFARPASSALSRRAWSSPRGLSAAARGRSDVVHALVDEVVAWAKPRGIEMPVAAVRYAQVLDALGRGGYEGVIAPV